MLGMHLAFGRLLCDSSGLTAERHGTCSDGCCAGLLVLLGSRQYKSLGPPALKPVVAEPDESWPVEAAPFQCVTVCVVRFL